MAVGPSVFAKIRQSERTGIFADNSGATAVEFAIIAPLFIALVCGIGQIAYAQHCASSLHFALRTVSRSLMLDPTLTEQQLEEKVQGMLSNIGNPDIELTLEMTEQNDGRYARITGRYEVEIPVPLLDRFPITYRSTVTAALSP